MAATVKETKNLFIKNLPEGTDDESLRKMFAEFGEIESLTVQRDAGTGKLKDYGYVAFKTVEQAQNAINAMHKKAFGEDRFLMVNFHVSKKENEGLQGPRGFDPITQNLTKTFNANIYVKFIPAETTEEEVRKKFTFAEDVQIVSLKINTSIKKYGDIEIKSQYAYIMYDTVGNAQKAIQRFDQQYLFGGSKPISVEMWVSKDEKEQERRRREDRQTKQLLGAILGSVLPPPMPQQNY